MEWLVISYVKSSGTVLKDVEIIVYGEEPRPAYDRVHLSELLFRIDRGRSVDGTRILVY